LFFQYHFVQYYLFHHVLIHYFFHVVKIQQHFFSKKLEYVDKLMDLENQDNKEVYDEIKASIDDNQNIPYIIFETVPKKIADIIDETTRKKSHANYTNKRQKKLGLSTNRHIPPYCPDFPDPLTYQHTPVFWRKNAVEFSQHERNNESKHDEKDNIEQNDIEKTRKIIIENANIFSQNIKNLPHWDKLNNNISIFQFNFLITNKSQLSI